MNILGGTVISGISKLELEFSRFTRVPFCVACNSGTSALHLALATLKIGKEDDVIVPEFTMIACPWAVAYTGARVIPIDCDDNLNIDVDLLESVITPRTKAIIPTHIYGRICNMEEIVRFASRHNIAVIEDCAEAHGAESKIHGVFKCYSFYKNKIIHAEEGGMVCTPVPMLAQRAAYLKNMAFGDKHDYIHNEVGFNMRMPESQAKMVSRSLRDYPKNIKKRRQIESWLNTYVTKDVQMPERDTVWVYDMLSEHKEKITAALTKNKIQWRHFFKPVSMQPTFYNPNFITTKAYQFSKFGFYLPLDLSWNKADIIRIANIINENAK